MSNTLLYETKSVLKELKHLRASVEVQLQKASKFSHFLLSESYSKGSSKHYYYMRPKGSKKRNYLGSASSELVKEIKTAKYFEQLLKIIEHDICLLEALDKEYVEPDFFNIMNRLSRVYQQDSLPLAAPVSDAAAEWKRRKELEKSRYEPYRPQDLKHMAQDGTMMRSLSEVLIANYLISLGITFVYELPLRVNGKIVIPDFTILSPIDNKTEIIIEHQGAMGNEDYHKKYIRTLLFYLDTQLVPNKDVFFTFNHLNGTLDMRQIDSILRTAFGFTPNDSSLS